MNLQILPAPTQGQIPDRLPSADAQALSAAAADAIADIASEYGWAPDWSPLEHYQLMHEIFTEPTTALAAA